MQYKIKKIHRTMLTLIPIFSFLSKSVTKVSRSFSPVVIATFLCSFSPETVGSRHHLHMQIKRGVCLTSPVKQFSGSVAVT